MKREIFLFAIISLILFLLQQNRAALAQVNVIEDWGGETLNKIQKEFGSNALVVAIGSPNNQLFADTINAYSFTWVIRGHAHWLPIGQEMFNSPESAAQKWNNFFQKLNKKVYFQPWNEPTSINPECFGQNLESCVPKIVRFINALDPSKIILTTPAFDPHNQENTVEKLIELMKTSGLDFNKFQAVTINVYDPDLAKSYHSLLSQWGLAGRPIIFTETGLLSYDAQDICQNMYCAGVIEKWQSDSNVVGWAIFSRYQGWNLWQHQCVIDALKGNCHCQNCEAGRKRELREIVQERFNRQPQKATWKQAKVGRNWFPGPSTANNDPSLLQRFLNFASSIINLFRLPHSLDWVPSDNRTRPYPAEDYKINYELATGRIDFNGTIGEFCIPTNTITHKIKFFPLFYPSKFTQQIMNITSIHHWVFRGLNVFTQIIDWYTGFAFDENKPFIDIFSKDGPEKLQLRGITNLNAGFASKAIPGEMYDKLVNEWTAEYILAAATPENKQSPQQKGLIALFDRPLAWICEGKGILVESDFTKTTRDGRIDRTYAEGCHSTPLPIRPSLLFCCNQDFFENNPIAKRLQLDYQQTCAHVVGSDGPGHWSCQVVKSMEGTLYSFYYWARLLVDGLVSHADLPVYLENCYPVAKNQCKNDLRGIKNGFFIDLSPEERYQIFPVATENNWPTQNSFFTRAEEKCWKCQIVKTYIPNLLGTIDACSKMAQSYLPQRSYQNTVKNTPKKVFIPCNPGKAPGANGREISGKANEDYINPVSIASHDLRSEAFFSEHKVSNCETSYDEKGIPKRCKAELKIRSRTRLYLERYDQIRQCIDFLYGLLDGSTAEELEQEIVRANGNKINPRDLPAKALVSDTSVYSGLEDYNREEQWNNSPNSISGKSHLKSSNEIYIPGGGMEITKEVVTRQFIPGELQKQ